MDSTPTLGPPYGPPANIKTIIETWRDRSMPEQVTKEWLERIGLSANLATRNLHALRFLGLVDENGYTTEVAERLRVAPGEEYASVLEGIVRKAYSKIFEIRDPSIDSRQRVEDAFRHETPTAQRPRMVACFLGLCSLAGIPLKEGPPARETVRRVGQARRLNRPAEEPKAPPPASEPPQSHHSVAVNKVPDSRVAEMFLAKLPEFNPEWSSEVQAKWFDAFTRLQESLQK